MPQLHSAADGGGGGGGGGGNWGSLPQAPSVRGPLNSAVQILAVADRKYDKRGPGCIVVDCTVVKMFIEVRVRAA